MLTKVLISFTTLKRFATLRSPEAQNFTAGIFRLKNGTRVDYYEVALCMFYYCFLQVSFLVNVYKTKKKTKKKTSNQKESSGDPTLGRDP